MDAQEKAKQFELLREVTYKECGIKKVEPLGRMVFVRTTPLHQQSVGGIWLASTASRFHKGMMHKAMVNAIVLEVGPTAKLGIKAGDEICFTRMYFSYYKQLEDGTYFGYIDETQVAGYSDGARVEGTNL